MTEKRRTNGYRIHMRISPELMERLKAFAEAAEPVATEFQSEDK